MKQRVYKLFVNFEKEENWLNHMAAQGLHCVNYVFGLYTFEKGQPGEYMYRLQLLENRTTHPESIAYREFLEDTGVEMIATYGRWVYWRKKTVDGPFNLYSDKQSRIEHYQRILRLLLPLAAINYLFSLRVLHRKMPIHLINMINLGVALLLTYHIATYYRRITQLKKESTIRE